MEDFPLLILFFIIYCIAGASGKKKKNKRNAGRVRQSPMRTRARGEQADARAQARDRETAEGFRTVFDDAVHDGMQSCDGMRIHLHDATQEQMRSAAEGDDPCHAGGIQSQIEETDHEADPVMMQDVLRGVIMSEILTRPCERAAMRRGRR